ncbi:zinc-dependent metalloprotease [Congregibacter brevis]|uniref:Zinc-dependent metalloprotease n=1 Tax=Congregibacter brevis TaxID=3081201 RepID=A0ABZ0IFB1_9GAMM|nr:zinc-dependent metalloprotease [Congregibacter sp. IMCC45268]
MILFRAAESTSQGFARRTLQQMLIVLVFAASSHARSADLPSLADKVAGAEHMPGYFDLYWDSSAGAMYLEIDKLDTEFLYQVSMGSGLGSNPIGIDRGQVRGTHILEAKRVGPRVLLIEPNYRYRATSDNQLERTAVKDAFAPSVHWGFDIVAEGDSSILVDATEFFLRDARNVVGQIKRRDQGKFKLEKSRSAIYLDNTAAFPENIEVEAMLTFTSDAPGDLVNKVAATGSSITLRQHHSIVKLPDDGFKTRISDPRIGTNGPTIQDYGTAIGEDLVVRLVARHRLEKKNPSAAQSEAIEPIVYYLDPGVPEPIKSALIEGGRWWNQAFEAAGFIDAFQVRELPAGVDAQDIRYNMIHWTHRRTRGYSYGYSVVDPRTGEIIKGNVNLGSLRLRQDYLHGQGLIPGFDYLASATGNNSASVNLALDRVRQLSAHEIGHTLGFPHNYLASSYGRESVMDYPAPLVEITEDGELDFSNAYPQRIGDYDKLAVRYSYTQFDESADEAAELGKIVQESLDSGLLFMAHNNNNFRGAGHPYASVWDNGDNLVDHLKHEIKVREIGLNNFGEELIRAGEPVSTLEYVLLPLYMHHRFQMNAAAQSIGGADYRNTLRGDGQQAFTIIDAEEQRDALSTVLSTLDVDFLTLPKDILALLPPRAQRFDQGEAFPGRTGLYFDALGAVEASVSLTVQTVLHPARMERVVAYGSMGDYPTLEEVVDAILEATWSAEEPNDDYRKKVLQVVQQVTTREMMISASNPKISGLVRAVLVDRLNRLRADLEKKSKRDAHRYSMAAEILHWQETGEAPDSVSLKMPPGDPI